MSGREHGHDPALPHHAAVPIPQSSRTDELEVVPGFERENLQGWIPELATETDIRAVIEKAFDYRGDVTISRKDGSQITGYLVRPPNRFDSRQFRRSPDARRKQPTSRNPLSPKSQASPSPDATPPPVRATKPGSRNIGRSEPRARRIFRLSRRSWSSQCRRRRPARCL